MPEIIDRRISFNGGELSPWLDPRIDLDKYRSGCRQLENMLPAVYGGALRRPGTAYLGAAPTASGKVRLVPFVASVSTTYILEFSALKLRIWTTGATPALVKYLSAGTAETTTITVTSDSGMDQKTIILYDNNNASVGVWLDDGSTSPAPAAALACATQLRIDVSPAMNTTDVADLIADALEAHTDFTAQNVANVATVTATRTGVRTNGSNVDALVTVAVTVQGVDPVEAGVLEIVTTYLEADLDQLQFCQQNDVLFIAHPDHPPKELARYSANDWRLGALQVFWPATLEENVSETTIDVAPITTTGEGAATAWSSATSYTTLGGKVAHSSKTWALKTACVNVEPGSGALAERHWMETHGASPTTDQCYGAGQQVTLTATGATFASTDIGSKWVVVHKREEMKVVLLGSASVASLSAAVFALGEWSAAITASGTGSTDFEIIFLVQRSFDNINWETRNVLTSDYGSVQKLITGFEKDPCFLRLRMESKVSVITGLKASIEVGDPASYAIYEIISHTSSTSVKALVYFPPWGLYTATRYWHPPAWSVTNGFPRAVTLHQGRLYFGGTAMKPTTFWGSAVDGYQDFRVAAEDDSAVAYTLNSDEASGVEWLVSQDSLVIGTASGEWVFGSKTGETTEKLRRNTSYGSLPVQARTIADALVFIQRSGRKVREFAWSFERDGYNSVDLSMLAEHVGDSVFLQMAIQRNPDPIIWVVTTAGELLALTYERSQKVAAWSRHTTDGFFESVAAIPGSGEDDQIWVAVQRTVNGTTSRFIERITPDVVRMLKSGTNTTLVYSDCSKTSVSSGSGLVSGLGHLEAKSVSLLVDGKVHAPVTVSGGTVQLAASAANYNKTVVAGLPYDSILEPTYLETMDPNSVTLAGKKRLHRAVLEFWKSGAVNVSTDAGVTFKPITFAAGVTLMTGPHEMYLDGSSARQVTAIFKQSDPLPFNLMGVILRYNVEMG